MATTPADMTDEEIAARVQHGNAEIFGVLMARYEPKLSRYARKFLTHPDDCADVVQDVFIKSYTNIRSFDTARKFSPWIYRIAHNEFINTIRKKRREPVSFFDPDVLFPHPAAKETADGDLTRADLRGELDQGLSKLSAKYREVLVLYYFEELEYREIADILKIPIATVGVRLRRAKEMLRKNISPVH